MNNSKLSRRVFCSSILSNGAALVGAGAILSACGGGAGNENGKTQDKPATTSGPTTAPPVTSADACTDFSNIDPAELKKREALGYVEKSPIPDNLCENCKLFIPWQNNTSCGGCMLFQGPVQLDAYCTYWADPEI
jgi:hypothetical protein